MIGHLAHAAGSPCPTVVLDSRQAPREEGALVEHLTAVRGHLSAAGGGHVLKMALVRPAEHPMFDLDYRFAQALPAGPDRFDLRGSCGHSILAAVVSAARCGMLPPLVRGARIRVHVLNTADSVVCDVEEAGADGARFTVSFVQPRAVPFAELLPDETPRTVLEAGGVRHEVSLVSAGNPYVFVDARTLGIADQRELFAAGPELFDRLVGIRLAAAERLGLPPTGAFPKVAALLPGEDGGIAARAVSVPAWHPTLALTGAICLGAAAGIPGTLAQDIAKEGGHTPGAPLALTTPGGRTAVTAVAGESAHGPALAWATVAHKQVSFQGSITLAPLDQRQPKEVDSCRALSTAA
ncbi:PrpF domain-containing protein [Streptomyces sp. NBC_00239]|uniref:PrpF domain-containing protein n=1 Tax=Streptomyces sp. NBC_00239 TaxID=2903640 RepID=UPI002E2C0196|nr:PrpF domain-containing protein [Streptomyces sp. NBC_00239]